MNASDELRAERDRLYLSVHRLYRWPRTVVLTDEQRERRAGKLPRVRHDHSDLTLVGSNHTGGAFRRSAK